MEQTAKYNFDEIINREGTNAMSVEGYKNYLFSDEDRLDFIHPYTELISMWVADMQFATAPTIIQAIKDRLDRGIIGYSQVFDPEYKTAFQKWALLRYDWNIEKKHIVTSHGVVPALFDLIELICQPDEKVLIMTPSYALFKHAIDANKRIMISSDLILKEGRFCMDFDDIRQKVEDEKLTLCILCSPHNPTGRLWTNAELKKLGQICFDNNVVVISDEVHCDLLRTDKKFTPLAKLFPDSQQIITCMAPSKTFNLAGLMLANIIIPNDVLREKWKKQHFPLDNPLSIAGAQAAYTSGHDWLQELTSYLDQNFEFLEKYLIKHLPEAIFQIPDSTYLAWINLSAYFDENENLTLFFANNSGVLLEGGNMFVSNADGYIRLNLACPRSVLEEGLNRIVKSINTVQK